MYSAIKEVPKDVRLEEVLEEVLEGVRGGLSAHAENGSSLSSPTVI